MPLPPIYFNQQSSAELRLLTLHKLEEWMQTPEVSQMKKSVLELIIDYAKRNFIPKASLFGYVKKTSEIELKQIKICETLFQNAELPDLLFLQFVLNQFSAESEGEFKKSIVPLTQQNKEMLMVPLIHQSRQVSLGIFLSGLVLGQRFISLCGATGFLLSRQIAEWRIAASLENKLALMVTQGAIAHVEDGYDEGMDVLSRVANHGLGFASRLFQLLPIPKGVENDEAATSPQVKKV